MTARELAIYVAGAAHQKQMYGESPYLLHLSAVDSVLKDACFGEGSAVRLAAWLHDVLEDAPEMFTRQDLEKMFGPGVAEIVWRVTNEPGANRAERAQKTYPKIAGNDQAIVLKLADRIANIEHSLRSFSRFGLMYVKEDTTFQYMLYDRMLTDPGLDYLWSRYFRAIKDIRAKFGM
jgi:(p)ppGpp synthase/HD superfamily hydrolase